MLWPHGPFPHHRWTGAFLLCAVLGGSAVAQVPQAPELTSLDPCESVLALAERRYAEEDYAAVGPLVLDCAYRPGARDAQRQRAYRLLALASIRQDLLIDARLAIVKLLGVDYAYEPDEVTDPPAYVALVESVKDQLRVDAAPQTTASPRGGREEPAAEVPAVVVNVNIGTAEELDKVPGIGPALAARIIEHREEHGPFRRVEDLQEVAGIGPRSLERMASHLTTEERTKVVVQAGGGVPGAAPFPVPAQPPAATRGAPEPLVNGHLINLNRASAAELEALDGIGPALAVRVVEYREAHGPFRRVEDVIAVRGVGPRTLERFAARVIVD